MIDRFMGMAVGQVSRCINQACMNIFLMSTDPDESYRELCPVCQLEAFETAFSQPDDADQKSDC